MTSEHHDHQPPKYADRCYRSAAAIAAGVVLLAIVAWLGIDAIVRGTGRVPWTAVAGMVFAVPLITAFTLRPAVFAGDERLRIRNPFRKISITWPAVETLRSGYSTEVVADGRKFQLWSIPVSMRSRKTAQRHNERVRAGRPPTRGVFGIGPRGPVTDADMSERRAESDKAIDELRTLARRHGGDDAHGTTGQTGTVTVRWAYEILAPALVGAVALVVLWTTG